MRGFALVLAAGCGRIGFPAVGDGATADAACTSWSAFSTPQKMPAALQSSQDDWFLTPTLDGDTFFFHSFRAQSNARLYTTTQVGGVFSPPVEVTALEDATLYNMEPTLTNDGLSIVFTRWNSTTNDYELWSSQRAKVSDPWRAPEIRSELNDGSAHSADLGIYGGTILFSRWNGPSQQLDLWSSGGGVGSFTVPHVDPILSSPANEASPTVTGDHLEIFFASDRAGGPGGWDVYHSTRPTATSNWSPPTLVPELSSPRDEFGLRISPNGTTMYLGYNTLVGGGANADFYFATRTCQ